MVYMVVYVYHFNMYMYFNMQYLHTSIYTYIHTFLTFSDSLPKLEVASGPSSNDGLLGCPTKLVTS